jgi:hypothetical protein
MTRLAFNGLILLATREEMHRVWGRFDHERPGFNIHQLILVFSGIVVAVAAVVVWRVLKRRAARTFSSDSTAKLFRELCAAHGINRSGRRLLKQLADASRITNPAVLFVDPRYFQAEKIPRELRTSAKELRLLHETLFGG